MQFVQCGGVATVISLLRDDSNEDEDGGEGGSMQEATTSAEEQGGEDEKRIDHHQQQQLRQSNEEEQKGKAMESTERERPQEQNLQVEQKEGGAEKEEEGESGQSSSSRDKETSVFSPVHLRQQQVHMHEELTKHGFQTLCSCGPLVIDALLFYLNDTCEQLLAFYRTTTIASSSSSPSSLASSPSSVASSPSPASARTMSTHANNNNDVVVDDSDINSHNEPADVVSSPAFSYVSFLVRYLAVMNGIVYLNADSCSYFLRAYGLAPLYQLLDTLSTSNLNQVSCSSSSSFSSSSCLSSSLSASPSSFESLVTSLLFVMINLVMAHEQTASSASSPSSFSLSSPASSSVDDSDELFHCFPRSRAFQLFAVLIQGPLSTSASRAAVWTLLKLLFEHQSSSSSSSSSSPSLSSSSSSRHDLSSFSSISLWLSFVSRPGLLVLLSDCVDEDCEEEASELLIVLLEVSSHHQEDEATSPVITPHHEGDEDHAAAASVVNPFTRLLQLCDARETPSLNSTLQSIKCNMRFSPELRGRATILLKDLDDSI